MTDEHPLVVVMGVAGCGKSTLGEALASELVAVFRDGDAFHPPANVAKMHAGQPLAVGVVGVADVGRAAR